MSRRWAIPLIALGVAVFASATPAFAQTPTEILVRSLEPLDTTFVGEQIAVTVARDGRIPPRAARQVQQVFRSKNRLRINFPGGRVAFDDGASLLVFNPQLNVVERSPSAFELRRITQQRRAFQRGAVKVTQLADDTVAGRACFVVELDPGREVKRRVWVDKQTYLQLRQDILRPNGQIQRTYFTRIDFDRDPPAEQLAYTPPAGVPIVTAALRRPIPAPEAARLAREWGGLYRPTNLPTGYSLRGYFTHNFGSRAGLAAVYDGPQGAFTLFQGPAIGMTGPTRRQQRLRVVSQQVGQADVLLVGPLPEEEIQKVMRSLDAQP